MSVGSFEQVLAAHEPPFTTIGSVQVDCGEEAIERAQFPVSIAFTPTKCELLVGIQVDNQGTCWATLRDSTGTFIADSAVVPHTSLPTWLAPGDGVFVTFTFSGVAKQLAGDYQLSVNNSCSAGEDVEWDGEDDNVSFPAGWSLAGPGGGTGVLGGLRMYGIP